jgi:hypothetical protein
MRSAFSCTKAMQCPNITPHFWEAMRPLAVNAAMSGLWLLAWRLQEHRQKAAQQTIQITQ